MEESQGVWEDGQRLHIPGRNVVSVGRGIAQRVTGTHGKEGKPQIGSCG